MHGLVVLDYGRHKKKAITSSLVQLVVMAQRTAQRLREFHAGRPLDQAPLPASTEPPTARSGLEIRCFGPLEIFSDGAPIAPESFPRSKALTLLKILVARAGAPISRDALAELLWPGVGRKSGVNRLHGVLHALRAVIEPHRKERRWIYILNHGDLYYFNTESKQQVDLFAFRECLDKARQIAGSGEAEDRQPERMKLIETATALYRGDLFEDDPYSEWCKAARVEAHEANLEALKTLAEHHVESEDANAAIQCLRRALKFDPFREDLQQSVIKLLLQTGRRNDALAQYEECVRLLQTELDTAPLPETLLLGEKLQVALSEDR
jgi:DNA-binding SARP family transcriptional activator